MGTQFHNVVSGTGLTGFLQKLDGVFGQHKIVRGEGKCFGREAAASDNIPFTGETGG